MSPKVIPKSFAAAQYVLCSFLMARVSRCESGLEIRFTTVGLLEHGRPLYKFFHARREYLECQVRGEVDQRIHALGQGGAMEEAVVEMSTT
eukprot:346009-Amphidinium_carterae.1